MVTDSRTAAPPPPTYVGYSIACTEEYRGWLRALSARTLIPASVIVREALKQWAVTRGHAAPPPR